MMKIKNNISVISLHIFDFSSKSNGSIHYLYDCVVIFVESLLVFMNISMKPMKPYLFSALLAENRQIST